MEKSKFDAPIEAFSPQFSSLIAIDTPVEILADGFLFTEGPLWDHRNHRLLFSDIPANKIYYWSPNGDKGILLEPSYYSNGLTFDTRERLIICEHQNRSISGLSESGHEVICNSYLGKQLNSPNDVISAADGSILFSDPIYGLRVGMGGPAEQELSFQGVFRFPADGNSLQLISDNFERPNGLALSPDQSLLYVTDTVRQHIRIFRILDHWRFEGGEVWAELWDDQFNGRPDGMKVDIFGNVFCTGPGGIWIFNPQADLLGRIYLPDKTSNLAWGEDDRSLFITSSGKILRIRCLTYGIIPNK